MRQQPERKEKVPDMEDIMYMEVKLSGDDEQCGEARIVRAEFSKSGRTIYYNCRRFMQAPSAPPGNYVEVDTGQAYWIVAPQKDGSDRFYRGKSVPVLIDENAREEYWTLIRKQPERINETTT